MAKKSRKTASRSKRANTGGRDLFLKYHNAGNHALALQVLQSKMKGRVIAPQVYVDALVTCIPLQKWDAAIAYGQKAIQKLPNSIPTLDGLSHALWVKGDYEGVKHYGRQALLLRDQMVPDVPPIDLDLAVKPAGATKNVISFS